MRRAQTRPRGSGTRRRTMVPDLSPASRRSSPPTAAARARMLARPCPVSARRRSRGTPRRRPRPRPPARPARRGSGPRRGRQRECRATFVSASFTIEKDLAPPLRIERRASKSSGPRGPDDSAALERVRGEPADALDETRDVVLARVGRPDDVAHRVDEVAGTRRRFPGERAGSSRRSRPARARARSGSRSRKARSRRRRGGRARRGCALARRRARGRAAAVERVGDGGGEERAGGGDLRAAPERRRDTPAHRRPRRTPTEPSFPTARTRNR